MFTVQLDVCTICQLNCVACSMRRLNYGELKAGYLKFENFKKFVDMNDGYISRIEISNYGEPFLNPDIIKILEYAYKKGITVTCFNGTNFNTVSDEVIKAIVDYEVKGITLSIDGASQKSYSQYRRNGNFDTVMSNVRKLVNYKREKESSYPELIWQYVIRESTEDEEEILKAKDLALELGMQLNFKPTWEKRYVAKNPERLQELTGLTFFRQNSVQFEAKNSKAKTTSFAARICRQSILDKEWVTINWDGRYLACCKNQIPFNIDLFQIPLKDLDKELAYISSRNYVNGLDYKIETPCTNCSTGKVLRENLKEIEQYDKF